MLTVRRVLKVFRGLLELRVRRVSKALLVHKVHKGSKVL
jgi:hypothetical protein